MDNSEMIHVVDYGLGNLGSIINMFRRIGVDSKLVTTEKEIAQATKIILPGVGAFDQGMNNLAERGIVDVLNHKVLVEKTPVLGVCVGMQLMSEGSEEGVKPGLGWIKGITKDMRRLVPAGEKTKFPHIGWNFIDQEKSHPILNDMPDDPRFYFVHTFQVDCAERENLLATTEYGSLTVTAMFTRDNIIGAQFHPEKSHKFGMQIFKNFSKWVPSHE